MAEKKGVSVGEMQSNCEETLPETKHGNGVFKVGPFGLVAGLQVTNSVDCNGGLEC